MRSNAALITLITMMSSKFPEVEKKSLDFRGKSDADVRQMIIDKMNKDQCHVPSAVAGDMLGDCATYEDAQRLTTIALQMSKEPQYDA
jgi:hypothetical protein